MEYLQTDGFDDSAGWPAYVDFLSTFCFILFIFIGSLLFIMFGGLSEKNFQRKVDPWIEHLKAEHIDVTVDGLKIHFDLRKHVDFANNSYELKPDHKEYLARLARELPAMPKIARDCNIVVLGTADAVKFQNDPFGNWSLSAKRALAVLQFLYNCQDCGYDEALRNKLVLLGEGDVKATGRPDAGDRRVDLVVDCTREVTQ